jgi:hypothetical protein
MNRLDRALGILLLLRGGKTYSAAELSRRFEVQLSLAFPVSLEPLQHARCFQQVR